MKSINYIIISFFIIMTLCSGIFLKTDKTQTITLQTSSKDAGTFTLKQSADIISTRLNLYGIKSFDVKVGSVNGQLKIQLADNINVAEIEDLITSRGELAFYETYSQEEIAAKLGNNNQLLNLLSHSKDVKSSDPRVGCASIENRKKADGYLKTAVTFPNCKFAWQSETGKSEDCLFALKTDNNGNPVINRSDIESVKITNSVDGAKIMIKLKSPAAATFAEATKANLNKSIAIVIDDRVYSWPVVRTVIEKGEIEVTGSFTENEVKYFPVIFNTDRLPLSFKLIK